VKRFAAFLKFSVVVSEMNLLKMIGLSLCAIAVAACTTTPDKYKNKSSVFSSSIAMPLDNGKAQVVANAGVGVPQVYTDKATGRSVELVVQSEYFSANGRVCRRFTEFVNGRDVAGLSCKSDRGWTEIPLSAFVQ